MEEPPIILFDGICNFCNRTINYVIKQDKKNIFRFAPIQSNAGIKLLNQFNLAIQNPESFILIDSSKAYQNSTAALKVLNKLSWHWKWTQLFWLIPKFFRDAIYKLVSRNRYKWFGKKEQCMIPDKNIRARFLN